MTTTILGPVTRETGAPPASTTQWPVFTSNAAIQAALRDAQSGVAVAAFDIAMRVSRTDTSGLLDSMVATGIDTAIYPAYTNKSDFIQDLLNVQGAGQPLLFTALQRFTVSGVSGWTDKGSFAN